MRSRSAALLLLAFALALAAPAAPTASAGEPPCVDKTPHDDGDGWCGYSSFDEYMCAEHNFGFRCHY